MVDPFFVGEKVIFAHCDVYGNETRRYTTVEKVQKNGNFSIDKDIHDGQFRQSGCATSSGNFSRVSATVLKVTPENVAEMDRIRLKNRWKAAQRKLAAAEIEPTPELVSELLALLAKIDVLSNK